MTFQAGSIEYTVETDTKELLKSERDVDKSARGMSRSLENTDKSSRKLEKSLGTLSRVASGVITAISIRQINTMADNMIRLNNRIRTVTTSNEDFESTQKNLFIVAQRTNSTLSATVELYARIARNTKELNLSQSQTLTITKALNQAFQIGGASTAEAAASTIQLSQALASGVLRGDEFNSVAEQAPLILEALSKELGRGRGELRKMAEQGRLTADVLVNAIISSSDQWDKEFQGLRKTSDQTWTLITNASNKFVESLDKSVGVSKGLNELLIETAAIITALSESAPDIVAALSLGFTPLRTLIALITDGADSALDVITGAVDEFGRISSGEGLSSFLDNLKKARDELSGNKPLEININGGQKIEKTPLEIALERAEKKLNEIGLRGNEVAGAIGDSFGDAAVNGVERFSTSMADAIIQGDSLEDSLRRVAAAILTDLLSALIRIGIQSAIGQATAVATGAATGGALAAAYAPAAALASLASFGANAAPAAAAITATTALASSTALAGGLQYGGGANANSLYRVGEAGPEIFSSGGKNFMIPGENGKVISNNEINNGGSTQNNVNLTLNIDPRTPDEFADQLIRQAPLITNLVEKAVNDRGRSL